MPTDYGLQAGGSIPLYGSHIVVNGYAQQNVQRQPQMFRPAEPNQNFALPNSQIINSRIPINSYDQESTQQQFPIEHNFNQYSPSKQEPFNSNTNYPGSIHQQIPIRQNFNQNSVRVNPNGNVNPELETIPFSNAPINVQGSQFLLDQNNYEPPNKYEISNNYGTTNHPLPKNYGAPNYGNAPDNHGNVQENQNTYLKEQEQNNQRKNKVLFPLVKGNSPNSQTGFNGDQNPSNINPNSWMKGQLKEKQATGQHSYPNSHTNDQSLNDFQANHFNKQVPTFDQGNRQQLEHNKQTNFQNNYDSFVDTSQSHTDYGQQSSVSNGQGYNLNPSTGYSASSKFNQPEQPQNMYPTSQDRQSNVNFNPNKEFKIVVPNMSTAINNREQSELPTSYPPNPNLPKEQIINRDSSSKKSLNNNNGAQYPNQNENSGLIQNPSYTDNSRSPSQDSPAYSTPTISRCPIGFNGIKPHPTDCSKFLSCANGRTFEMPCGPGTLFNPTISVCDHPYNVACDRTAGTTTTQATIIEDDTSFIDQRQQFDYDTSSSSIVTENISSNQNQAVLETLPVDNRQLKALRNPTSIDLPDNFLPNSSIVHTSTKTINNGLQNSVVVKVDLKPNSTQSIRLRGGPKSYEGFLQVQEKPFKWGVVCDEPNSWTINKADIVCKQLGFKRYIIIIL